MFWGKIWGEKNWGGSLLEEKILAEKFCQGKKFEVKKNCCWGGGNWGGGGGGGGGERRSTRRGRVTTATLDRLADIYNRSSPAVWTQPI